MSVKTEITTLLSALSAVPVPDAAGSCFQESSLKTELLKINRVFSSDEISANKGIQYQCL